MRGWITLRLADTYVLCMPLCKILYTYIYIYVRILYIICIIMHILYIRYMTAESDRVCLNTKCQKKS